MEALPSLDGLSWSQIRQVAREVASSASLEDVMSIAQRHLTAPDAAYRQLAVYLLGFSSGERPENLEVLRDIRRTFPDLVAAETATWNLADPREQFTYQRVQRAR